MESEALRNIRTMRQVCTSLDNAKQRRLRTVNSLHKSGDTEPGLLHDNRMEQALSKEKSRMAAYEVSVMKSRQRLLKMREKLGMLISRNRAVAELRQEIQHAYWDGEKKQPAPSRQDSRKFNGMELRY